MSQRTPYGQGGHSSPSDVRFDSLSPHTSHSYADGPSSTPAEVGGSSTPPAPHQNCIMIRPLGSSFDNIWCKRDITRIIQSKFEKPYTSWKKTDPAIRDMWFGEFKKRWSWESELENQIRINFEKTTSDRLTDLLFRVRRDLTKKPSWTCPVVFEALKEYWNTLEFKNKSEKAKKNRSSDIGGSKHTCGSIPMSEHKKRLADFQMRQASSQSSAVGPTEDSDAAGQPSQAALDETSLWLEVAGGKKKGRVYGIGSEAHVIPGSYHVLSPPPPPP
ncbi:uncharacterized protein LOC127791616 [Diospyros lotus]|uniref:uncharacterized protein LOC127791616 n=1 Tax=Diospyros lotus TaxID=55363 RepID=UPI0022541130|nr:uncharacterized protein LOC127791616 [Diospyros lotus]